MRKSLFVMVLVLFASKLSFGQVSLSLSGPTQVLANEMGLLRTNVWQPTPYVEFDAYLYNDPPDGFYAYEVVVGVTLYSVNDAVSFSDDEIATSPTHPVGGAIVMIPDNYFTSMGYSHAEFESYIV